MTDKIEKCKCGKTPTWHTDCMGSLPDVLGCDHCNSLQSDTHDTKEENIKAWNKGEVF